MAAELDLINLALAKLGEETQVSDLAQDPPPRQLRVARALLPSLRDAMLRKYPWLCALRRRSLAKIPTTGNPDWGYASAFQLPPATLRVWAVNTGRPWSVGVVEERDTSGAVVATRRAILTGGDGPLRAVLVERVDYELLDPCLREAMATELASRMCGPLTADKSTIKALRDDAAATLAEAITAETSEVGNESPPFESAWLAARFGGGLDGWSYAFEGGSASEGVL